MTLKYEVFCLNIDEFIFFVICSNFLDIHLLRFTDSLFGMNKFNLWYALCAVLRISFSIFYFCTITDFTFNYRVF